MSLPNVQIPDWQLFLGELDSVLTEPTRLHCIGGFVVTQVYGFDRPTADLDVVEIAPLRERETLLGLAGKGTDLMHRTSLYLDYVGVSCLPEEYESRLTEVFPGRYKIFICWRSKLMISPSPSWEETARKTAPMSGISQSRFH
jgi:hypothetical protein